MNQFLAIAKNTYLQVFRQPAFGIIVLVTLLGFLLAPWLTGFTLDDDNKMLRDIGLSTLLVQGLFLACFAASGVVDAEIQDKTTLTVAAKPVGRGVFILGKYAGVVGALATAHYLASILFFMAMRHGVLQTAAESSDLTVIVFGPLVMLLAAAIAALLNYTYETRFLPAFIVLLLPLLTLSTGILMVIDRDFGIQAYETTQDIESLPVEVQNPEVFKGIIEFRPEEGSQHIAGHKGQLVRSNWKGPISDEDRRYLLGLVDNPGWRRWIKYLVDSSREFEAIEIGKAAVLILAAISLLAAVSIAASTRLGILLTFLVNIIVVCLGLASDQLLRPLATEEKQRWAEIAYELIPNFQCFWMVDALSESRIIPVSYMLQTGGYAALLIAAFLLLAMGLYQTREVG